MAFAATSSEPPVPEDPPVTVVARREIKVSPWLSLEEVELTMPGGDRIETYHGLRQGDAVTVLAMTPEGLFPLVRQFRPIPGVWTWELTAGAIDGGDDPAVTAQRELLEETGCRASVIIPVSIMLEDPPRRTNRLHGYFAVAEPGAGPTEQGLQCALVDGPTLHRMALSGDLALPGQVALLFAAACHQQVRAALRHAGFLQIPWMPELPLAQSG